MKKKYISPETLVIDIHFNHALLAGSPNGEGMVNNDGEPQDPGGFESRFFSFDDDE